MWKSILSSVVFALTVAILMGVNIKYAAASTAHVIVNGEVVPSATVQALENHYRTPVHPGRYWYDATSGLWGYECGPAVGVLGANLPLGGALTKNASCGQTNVMINGREIHSADLTLLQQTVGVVNPGRYWLDVNGNAGLEGGPMLVNVYQAAQQRAGNDGVYRHRDSNSSGIFSDGCSGITVKGANGSSTSAYVGC